jgi:hypothetical protein
MLQREWYGVIRYLGRHFQMNSPELSRAAMLRRAGIDAGRRPGISGRLEILGNKNSRRRQLWIASRFSRNRLHDITIRSRKAGHCTLSDL